MSYKYGESVVDLEELIEAVQNTLIGAEQFEQARHRMREAEMEFERLASSQILTKELLSKTYSL